MQALMPKEKHFELEGKARILQLFSIKGKQQSSAPLVAGMSVSSGAIKTSKPGKAEYIFRVYRGGNLLADNVIGGELKRFKDLVHEVAQGNECGLSFESFKDLEVDDEIECYRVEWKSKVLVMKPVDSSASTYESAETQNIASG
jgi:translation initiation factor IF-2